MKHDEFAKALTEIIGHLDFWAARLKRSVEQCQRFEDKPGDLTEAQDAKDLLLQRFNRLYDVFYHDFFGLVDNVAKLEIVEIADAKAELNRMREIRNEIVHKYRPEEQHLLYPGALERAPLLLSLVGKAHTYARQQVKVSLPPRRKSSLLEM